jgi:signal transduction histidine kinase
MGNLPNLKKLLAGKNELPLAEKILGMISDPVCAINSDRQFEYMNDAMRMLVGIRVPAEATNFSTVEFPDDLKQQVDHAFAAGTATEGSLQSQNQINDRLLFFFTWTPCMAKDGSVSMIIGVGRSDKNAEQALNSVETQGHQRFLLSLSDALRPLSDTGAIQQEVTRLLGEHLNVDRTYYAACDESLQLAVIERDYVRNGAPSLIGIHHYDDFKAIVTTIRTGKVFIARDVMTMADVQPQVDRYLGNQMRALVAMPLMKDREMVACLAITSSTPRGWSNGEISLLKDVAERTWEAVERARYENALKRNEQLMSAVFETLPVGVGLIEKDGTISIANKELARYLPENLMPFADDDVASRWKAWDAEGNPVDRSNFPGIRASRGESVLPGMEMLYTQHDGQEVWTQVAAIPIVDPSTQSKKLITVITDIDQIKRTKKALEEIEQQFRAFVAASSELVYRMSNDWGQMFNLTSNGFLKDTQEPIDDWLEVYIPKFEQARVKGTIASAIATKSIFKLEHRVNRADGTNGWVISTAIPLLDRKGNIREWLGAANDITARKTAEVQLQDFAARLEREVGARTRELKESRDQLQSILDTSLMQISILQAVRDEDGRVSDIEILLVNKEHERVMGRDDLIGVHYVKEYPGMKKSVLFDLIVKTIQTGVPQETEYYYPYENFNSWYASMFVKLNDGVVAFTMDISARKKAEAERFKNYLLLRQSEEMALLGSWDLDLASGVLSWSDGMYRLFEIGDKTEISPEIYLAFTTDEGRPAAERTVSRIRNAEADFKETLEMNINGHIKILESKLTVMRNEEGENVRILGVDMDVTASRAVDERIRQMEARQRQVLLRTTLASQEEERKRISESLHNGLGQLLYAIKISLSVLTAEYAVKKPEMYTKDRRYTDGLLKEAIAQSRRISHELMPSVLEDFGLSAAINDVCQQLAGKVEFSFKALGFAHKLDKYIELAVFRIVQELMLNVAKHSGATKASAEVALEEKDIHIKVTDNGRGIIEDGQSRTGIGLSSIRSKIRLLNGGMKIESTPGVGTTVMVNMQSDLDTDTQA